MDTGHGYPLTPTTETPPEARPSWVHAHPYLALCVLVGAALILVVGIVMSRSSVRTSTASNWSGGGSVFFGATGGAVQSRGNTEQRGTTVDIGPIALPTATNETQPAETDYGSDLRTLLAQLSESTQPSQQGTTGLESAFSFIPTGLISIVSPSPTSPEAAALRTYGNTVGTYIKEYEDTHGNSAQILKDQVEDRGNAEKNERLRSLGYDLAALGKGLELIEGVPPEAKSAHDAFATSYRIVGTNLTKVASATSDDDYLKAIEAYNSSVEALSKRFSVLVGVFSAHSVTFSPSDPGSAFMFNANLSL